MTDQDHIDRIDSLTRNARNTWFTLLAALVFVSVTLMGVQHIDFYGVDRATKLPLVGVDVPTLYFFVAAPILTAAIYGYFHLYLIRLWDALGSAPARLNDIRLGDIVTPWLVSDAALHFRNNRRQDDCTTPRPLESGAMFLNLLLAWVFGLSVLGTMWWLSMPARTWWMTGICGLALFISVFTSAASLAAMIQRLRTKDQDHFKNIFETAPAMAALLILMPTIALLSYQRTSGSDERLAGLSLYGENIVEKPAGWLPPDIARTDFRAIWCKREDIENCKDLGDRKAEFDDEWRVRRAAAVADMRRPDWTKIGNAKRDLRNADLALTFLSGADLSGAQMVGANLREAQMQGVNLSGAELQGTYLSGAQMQEADLSGAQMQGAFLNRAQMRGANLFGAEMQGADLIGAQLQGADLIGAEMQGATLNGAQMQGAYLSGAEMRGAVFFGAQMQQADLREAQMQDAVLFGAQLQRADLSGARMQGAILTEAQMQGANLGGAEMQGALMHYTMLLGTKDRPQILNETNLNMTTNNGGMLRFVDLRSARFDANTDFRNAFLDGSVEVAKDFRGQMGNPCQWIDGRLDDGAFFAHWRGWIEAGPNPRVWDGLDIPKAYRDITAVPPPHSCEWKSGPMPGNASE